MTYLHHWYSRVRVNDLRYRHHFPFRIRTHISAASKLAVLEGVSRQVDLASKKSSTSNRSRSLRLGA
jgi:hypothetical protein